MHWSPAEEVVEPAVIEEGRVEMAAGAHTQLAALRWDQFGPYIEWEWEAEVEFRIDLFVVEGHTHILWPGFGGIEAAVAAAEEGAEHSRLLVALGKKAAAGSLVALEAVECPGSCCTF